MAKRDPLGKEIFNENGILRIDEEDDVEAYRNLWLLYHFYMSAVSSASQLVGSPEDVFETTGRAN